MLGASPPICTCCCVCRLQTEAAVRFPYRSQLCGCTPAPFFMFLCFPRASGRPLLLQKEILFKVYCLCKRSIAAAAVADVAACYQNPHVRYHLKLLRPSTNNYSGIHDMMACIFRFPLLIKSFFQSTLAFFPVPPFLTAPKPAAILDHQQHPQ